MSNIKEMPLSLKSDTFSALSSDFDGMLRQLLQKAVGFTAVATEESVKPAATTPGEPGTPPDGPDIGDGETPGEGPGSTPGGKPVPGGNVIVPEFEQTSSGGGTEELAKETTGYFTEAEIKEEKA